MKVLIISSVGYIAGGAESQIAKLQSQLEKRGHVVKILASDLGGPDREYFNDYSFQTIESNNRLKLLYYLFNPSSFFALKKALREYKPDIIHIHTMHVVTPSVLFLLKNYPVVMTLHGPEYFLKHLFLWLFAPSKFKRGNFSKNNLTLKGKVEYFYFNYLQKFIFKLGLKNVDIFIAPSKYIQEAAKCDVSPIVQIPNFVEPMTYHEISNIRNLLFVGRLEKVKGVAYLLHAMHQIVDKFPDVQLIIIGDGPEKQNLHELAKSLELEERVNFLGWVEHAKLEEYYDATTLVVIPSIWPENFPTVCNEAMSIGRPVIGTNVGGIPEMIEHGINGYIVEPKQSEEIAKRAIALFEDENLLRQMSINARNRTEKFSVEDYIDKILNVYGEMVNKKSKKQKVQTSCLQTVKKPMQVLVVNAYVRQNAGDAALLSVLLDQIAEAFPNSKICIAGMESPQLLVDFEGKQNIGSIRHWTSYEDIFRLRRVVRKMIAVLIGLVWFRGPTIVWQLVEQCLPSEPRNELRALRNADLVVGLGGGYMRGAKGFGGDINVFFLLLPLALTKRSKKPLVLAPQSYGPFSSEWQKKAVRRVFHNIDAVFTREDVSMALLKFLGAEPKRLERAIDSGFAFDSGLTRDWRDELPSDNKIPLIGMTARQWLDSTAQAQYEEALSLTVNHIQLYHKGQVILIPQVISNYQRDDDRIVQDRIMIGCASESKPVNLTEMNSHRDLKSLYGSLDYLIGTRFHSVIFALTSFVPCIAIEYEHKTGGIMRELGLQRWIVPIEDVTAERLISLFDELLCNADEYRAHLHKVIPFYKEQSRTFVTVLKQMKN